MEFGFKGLTWRSATAGELKMIKRRAWMGYQCDAPEPARSDHVLRVETDVASFNVQLVAEWPCHRGNANCPATRSITVCSFCNLHLARHQPASSSSLPPDTFLRFFIIL